jgi:hypothetical protein
VGFLAFLLLASSFVAVNAVYASTSSIEYIYSDYTFTSDRQVSLVIAANGITIDGNGYTLSPETHLAFGIELCGRSTVTIMNLTVTGFEIGILLKSEAHDNVIMGTNVTANTCIGILLDHAHDNLINASNIVKNGKGCCEGYGIKLVESSGNRLFHNNFIKNAQHAGVFCEPMNTWDDGYPSGGNFWDDNLDAMDLFRGIDQTIAGPDGIAAPDGIADAGGEEGGLAPYCISGIEEDRYPLMGPFGPPVTILGLNVPVFPAPNVGLIFDEVVTLGTVSAQPAETVPPPPPGDPIVGPIIEITVTAGFAGNVLVRLAYDDTVLGDKDEALLTLWQVDLVLGDINIDGTVNCQDLWLIFRAWGSIPGHHRWDPRCDLNRDGMVNFIDFWIALRHFGDTAIYQEITVYLDTESNVIYGETSHFSHFLMR